MLRVIMVPTMEETTTVITAPFDVLGRRVDSVEVGAGLTVTVEESDGCEVEDGGAGVPKLRFISCLTCSDKAE